MDKKSRFIAFPVSSATSSTSPSWPPPSPSTPGTSRSTWCTSTTPPSLSSRRTCSGDSRSARSSSTTRRSRRSHPAPSGAWKTRCRRGGIFAEHEEEKGRFEQKMTEQMRNLTLLVSLGTWVEHLSGKTQLKIPSQKTNLGKCTCLCSLSQLNVFQLSGTISHINH